MYRKINRQRLNNLWSSKDKLEDKQTLEQCLDELCYQTELAECTWDYAFRFCQGIKKIFSRGVDPNKLKEHKLFTLKLLNLGQDLLECSGPSSDLYYLGGFIELKILDEWKNVKFYEFIVQVLKHIKKKIGFFSKKVKLKIIERIQRYNPELYRIYFYGYRNSS